MERVSKPSLCTPVVFVHCNIVFLLISGISPLLPMKGLQAG